ARAHFALQGTPLSVVGHTHIPLVVRWHDEQLSSLEPVDGAVFDVADATWAVNPGSVGQPRDGDPRASFAILDLERQTLTFHRATYDITRTQQLMEEADLPARLIRRLSRGR